MKRIILLLLVIAVTSCSWSTKDKLLGVLFVVGTAIDMTQTWEVMDDGTPFREGSVLLSSLSREEAMGVMIGVGTAILFSAHKFPEWRTPILVGVNSIRWGIVLNNERIGVGLSW